MAARTKKKRSLAWRIIDAVITLILIIILIFLVVNAIMSVVDKTYIPEFCGHQLYTIVTGSMVPTIPVGSLVSARSVTEKDKADYRRVMEIDAMENLTAEEKEELKRQEGVKGIEFGTIIVFNATSGSGEKIVVTHYFHEFENGYVRTFPEQFVERLDENGKVIMDNIKIESPNDYIKGDGYDFTTIDDIRAIYSWHIAGVGNFLLFLKSPQAIAMYAVIGLIILCGYLLIKKINKAENDKKQASSEIDADGENGNRLNDNNTIENTDVIEPPQNTDSNDNIEKPINSADTNDIGDKCNDNDKNQTTRR